jgi:hypothetical protein
MRNPFPKMPVPALYGELVVRWLSKDKQEELWDEVIQWPIGDLEAARKIREICNPTGGLAVRQLK